MTDRSPSLMVPGEWESRRSNVVPFVAAGLPGRESTPAEDADASPIPPAGSLAREWPAWARFSIGVGVLLAAMLLVMWGTSSVVR